MIKIDQSICTNYTEATSREWIETNGIGGYASGTVSGTHTRRYHGHLVAALRPPVDRYSLLAKFEEKVIIDGISHALTSDQYPDTVDPKGYLSLIEFRLDPFPVWTFEIDGVKLEKSLFMVHGENTSVIQWRVTDRPKDAELSLELLPLISFRDHHHLRGEDCTFAVDRSNGTNAVEIGLTDSAAKLVLSNNAVSLGDTGYWYRDFQYAIESERGFDHSESLYQPFSLTFDLKDTAVVIASTIKRDAGEADALQQAELERRAKLVVVAGAETAFSRELVLAADQFIVTRGVGNSVIAGYHWFSDWGRDTMIALSGLTLSTGRPEIAKNILREFSLYISDGMLPNRFPDESETPDYNTVDATLWYFEAIRDYAEHTGDTSFVKDELYDKLVDIIDWHIHGTRYNIRVEPDGLLHAGEQGSQLTWMDAKVGDTVFTPRIGKPVEIQALWYNALCTMSDLATEFADAARARQFAEMSIIARESFNGQFWNIAEECLFDVVGDDGNDASIRPNQIFAVSLHHSMLVSARAKRIVDRVQRDLLTPFGLRSLAADDPQYAGIYIGTPFQRDSSYHQGTVWGWLIGPFIEAYRKVHSTGRSLDKEAQKFTDDLIRGFRDHLSVAMLGQAAEIFDGNEPHAPRGAAAQAWSIAELLRVSSPNIMTKEI